MHEAIEQQVTFTRVWRPIETFNGLEWDHWFIVFLDCKNGGYQIQFVTINRRTEEAIVKPTPTDPSIGTFATATHWCPLDNQYDERFYPPGWCL